MNAPEQDTRPGLPRRDPRGHKGTFGAVVVLGGCAHRPPDDRLESDGVRMIGGPALSALAALRAGAGLAKLLMPEPVLSAGLVIAPSATGMAIPVDQDGRIIAHLAARTLDEALESCDALVIGPGLSVGPGEEAVCLRAVQQEDAPVVVDADALNNLARTPELWRDFRAQAILTPHPGEYARLGASLGIVADAKADPVAAAGELARRLGCVVALKGAATVVSDGHRDWTLDAPNPALATGGSGDVLAGIIGGLLGQHYKAPIIAGPRSVPSEGLGGLGLFDAACAGVRVHAMAARAWCDADPGHPLTGGMLATDLLDGVPKAVEALRAPR